jgi:hypothetical protein
MEYSHIENNWYKLSYLTHPRPLSTRREGCRLKGDGVSKDDSLTSMRIV